MLKRIWKRWVSLSLVIVMAISLLPAMTLDAFAAATENVLGEQGLKTEGDFETPDSTIKIAATSSGSSCAGSERECRYYL